MQARRVRINEETDQTSAEGVNIKGVREHASPEILKIESVFRAIWRQYDMKL